MTEFSIVIPVFNAVESLKLTLQSVINNTWGDFEVILVDDYSDEETRHFIDILHFDDSLNIRLIKTRNCKHSWTNASWNAGVALASGDYIAILNSDVTVSKNWNYYLRKTLCEATIACPMEETDKGAIDLDPVVKLVDAKMLKGACFMFERIDLELLFPIPNCLVHWCGDNYLADIANKERGVKFNPDATITHGITHSGRLIDKTTYLKTCRKDVLTYQQMSGRDMSLVLKHMG